MSAVELFVANGFAGKFFATFEFLFFQSTVTLGHDFYWAFFARSVVTGFLATVLSAI